jgi:hypothetical protein
MLCAFPPYCGSWYLSICTCSVRPSMLSVCAVPCRSPHISNICRGLRFIFLAPYFLGIILCTFVPVAFGFVWQAVYPNLCPQKAPRPSGVSSLNLIDGCLLRAHELPQANQIITLSGLTAVDCNAGLISVHSWKKICTYYSNLNDTTCVLDDLATVVYSAIPLDRHILSHNTASFRSSYSAILPS